MGLRPPAFIRVLALSFATALALGSDPARAGPPLPCVSEGELRASASAYHLTKAEVASLNNPVLCVGLRSVKNGTLEWSLLVVRYREDPDRLLWYTPHTNEQIAFDNAVAAVVRHHGTLVAVRTAAGTRCLQGQDPNRTFGTLKGGGDSCAGGGVRCAPSLFNVVPPFTAEVLGWHAAEAPIVGLHTNERGFDASAGCSHPAGGGNVTAACSRGGLTVLRSAGPARGSYPDDTMVYVAGIGSPEQKFQEDTGLASVVADMRRLGTNVIFEHVGRTDCSLSNYAVLHGLPHYFNVEVETSDASGQAAILEDLVRSMEDHSMVAGVPATSR